MNLLSLSPILKAAAGLAVGVAFAGAVAYGVTTGGRGGDDPRDMDVHPERAAMLAARVWPLRSLMRPRLAGSSSRSRGPTGARPESAGISGRSIGRWHRPQC